MNSNNHSTIARWFSPETLIQSLGIGLGLTVVARLAGLMRGVLFARFLDRAELGIWAITNSTMQMLSVVLVFGIPAGLCRYVARYERANQLRPFLARTLGVSLGLCTLACFIGLFCQRSVAWLIYEDERQSPMAVLLCLGSLALVALNLFQGVLQGLRVYRINAMMLAVQSLGFAVFGGCLIKWWQATAFAGVAAFLVISIVVTAIPCCLLWMHLQSEAAGSAEPLPQEVWPNLCSYSLGTWGASAVFALWGWLDRYVLLHFDTLEGIACLEQLGTYHIIENVTGPLLALGAGFSTQVLAHTVHLWESKQQSEARRLVEFVTKITMLLMMMVSAALIVGKRWLLNGVFGDATMASGEIIELMLASACLLTAQCMVRCYLLCQERVWTASMVWVVAVAVSLASNLLLVPFMHLKGAAITAAATSLISTWLLMWLTHRAGLRLDRSAWLATALPLILLLPPSIMLLGLALAAIATVRTDWLLTPLDRERIDGALQHLLVWRVSRAWQTMAR